jgi:hypothetical protein
VLGLHELALHRLGNAEEALDVLGRLIVLARAQCNYWCSSASLSAARAALKYFDSGDDSKAFELTLQSLKFASFAGDSSPFLEDALRRLRERRNAAAASRIALGDDRASGIQIPPTSDPDRPSPAGTERL